MSSNIPIRYRSSEDVGVPGFRLDIPRAALLVLLERPSAVLNIDIPGGSLIQIAAAHDILTPPENERADLSAWDVRGALSPAPFGFGGWNETPDAAALLSVIRRAGRTLTPTEPS